MVSTSRQPILFLPHGGGPLPLLDDPDHRPLSHWLSETGSALPRPNAILIISAHWEQRQPTLTAAAAPALIYDYYGFPPESYQLRYPAPGAPALANRIAAQLQNAGFSAGTDAQRGFDHGMFVPLSLLFPAADIPCLQLSLLSSLDPAEHIRLGEALTPLRDQDVLIVGSGMSFHNLPAMMMGAPPDRGDAFDDWLTICCTDAQLTPEQRYRQLCDWYQAPYARFSHPREEHLLPLHVCLGAAMGAAARSVFDSRLMGQRCRGFRWNH
ncbi:DODA-type extradiol aromatic ring-opening family dioxygenase [Motiliproteus sediminis]|uniref:DODA-type extradiol aromatic ring-opening family dioxygenase n=1 Tax=Motiliproteus sediminis TaxID=1468178 RepID=UPI001AEF7D36|nr:class III extradiol ring-cleavage dioxygenase [Motiliproteus sediminis]